LAKPNHQFKTLNRELEYTAKLEETRRRDLEWAESTLDSESTKS
jgi:hypothetical protein